MLKIYLAGPEVFLPNALEIGERKKRICESHGLVGLFPLDKEIEQNSRSPVEIAEAIYWANTALMNQADAIIANMTPFRGVSMDVGTAFEVGYCTAKGIPFFGYTNVSKKLADRVPNKRASGSAVLDETGLEIENFGLFENLMIEIPARSLGNDIIANEVAPPDLYTNLAGFEKAVSLAASLFDTALSRERARRLGER